MSFSRRFPKSRFGYLGFSVSSPEWYSSSKSPEIIIDSIRTRKQSSFNLIVNSQHVTGAFMNVEVFIHQFHSFNYEKYDKVHIQTYFIVELLQNHFNEFETEWRLLVKKANELLQ